MADKKQTQLMSDKLNTGTEPVPIEDLVAERLSPEVVEALKQVKIPVTDLNRWEETRPTVRITNGKGYVIIETKIKIPVQQVIRILTASGLGAAAVAAIKTFLF